MTKYKKDYLLLFALFVLPPIFVRFASEAGAIALNEELAIALTAITKIGIFISTIYFAFKAGFGKFWSVILGCSTFLPLFVWITFIIILLKNNKITKEDSYRESLEKIYIPLFEATMNKSYSEARKVFEDLYNKIIEESKKEGTDNLPLNYGDKLLEDEKNDEYVKSNLAKKRKEGVTDVDIKWWWNMHDYERRMMIEVDSISRVELFISDLRGSSSTDNASKRVRKFHPMYGDPNNTEHSEGDDRPLPYELKDRINIYIEKRVINDPEQYKEEIEKSSTFNALVRKEIRVGKI